MKQRSATPVSKRFITKSALVVVTAVFTFATIASMAPSAKADRYDDQIRSIQNEIDQYQAQASQLQNVANTLQEKLTSLSLEKAQIQAQVDLSQAQFEQLQVQIVQTQKEIKNSQDALGDTIADMDIDGNISPLEMLASSKNIGDYVDKQEFQSSIRDELSTTIKRITQLEKDLVKKKADTEKVLANQKNSRDALAAKEAEQAAILAETQGQQDAYLRLSSQSQAKQAEVRQQQQAAIAAAISSSGGGSVIASGQLSDYPWNTSNCAMGGPGGYYSYGGSDGNGGDGKGYGCRQCASYAAWRVAKETGLYPISWGNATDFPRSARNAGYSTGYSPRVGGLAVMHNGAEGHVAYVEEVLDGGASIIVSQYNYNYGAGYGMYSKMKLSTGAFQEFVYIR